MSKFSDSGGADDDSGLEPQFIRAAVQFPKALLYTLLSDGIRYYTYIERWNTSSTARTAGCCLYKYLYIGLYRHQCVCVYIYVDVFICDSGHMQLSESRKKCHILVNIIVTCLLLPPYQTPFVTFPYMTSEGL
jgi:hypothetical protein